MNPITLERWREAQRFEAEYWAREAKNPSKLERDIADGHHWTMGALDIRPATAVESVLDIAGGDYPLGEVCPWITRKYVVLDPATATRYVPGIWRLPEMAETYRGEFVDEVWGYNVLQHVQDPTAVIATAKNHATQRIRWFDVVDTPVYEVHPHSFSADWLRSQFADWRIVRDIEGKRWIDGHRQKFVALVAERVP